MLVFTFLARLISVLSSASGPKQIAAAVSFGLMIGLVPSFLLNALLFLLVVFLNVNLSAALLSVALFRLVAYLFDSLFHSLGYFLLVEVSFLRDFWTALYNTPLIPLTGFNNTVVLGSFFCALLLFLPLYVFTKRSMELYRDRYARYLQQSSIVRFIQASSLYRSFLRLRRIGDTLW